MLSRLRNCSLFSVAPSANTRNQKLIVSPKVATENVVLVILFSFMCPPLFESRPRHRGPSLESRPNWDIRRATSCAWPRHPTISRNCVLTKQDLGTLDTNPPDLPRPSPPGEGQGGS